MKKMKMPKDMKKMPPAGSDMNMAGPTAKHDKDMVAIRRKRKKAA